MLSRTVITKTVFLGVLKIFIVEFNYLGDSDKLTHLIYILVDNAIKYTAESGKVVIEMENKEQKKRQEFTLTVKDTGIGLSTEDQDKIFDRFCRVDKARTRKEGGYGLGLSFAKSIVDAYEGDINIKSESNQGTAFTVSIPFKEEAAKKV